MENEEKYSEVYSLDRIAQLYFRMHVPVGKQTGSFDYLQKTIKKNWPGTTELQKMKSRNCIKKRNAAEPQGSGCKQAAKVNPHSAGYSH